jgi:hypothetical protein
MEYWGNKDRYWTRNYMILQFWDYVDCVQVLFGNKHDCVFLFNQSSGHARKINRLEWQKGMVDECYTHWWWRKHKLPWRIASTKKIVKQLQ